MALCDWTSVWGQWMLLAGSVRRKFLGHRIGRLAAGEDEERMRRGMGARGEEKHREDEVEKKGRREERKREEK